jgi:hypothetical protein
MNGLELARAYYEEAVAPIVGTVVERWTAGRFGARSDAMGMDDEVSRDHGWGPACELLVEDEAVIPAIDAALRERLPVRFRGWSTSFDERYRLEDVAGPPVRHWVEIATVPRLLRAWLGVGGVEALRAREWLAMDEQKLVEITNGELFRDDLGFAAVRETLAYYPDDLGRHLMAVEWTRIADEQAFPGRAASRGDEAGAAIVQARLVESAMRLGFYLARRYPPYAKWFGSAYARLDGAIDMRPALAAGPVRDGAWAEVLRQLIAQHERAGLVPAGRFAPAPVYAGRPGTGIPDAHALIEALRAPITDPEVRALPPRFGSLNQMLGSRDLEEDARRWRYT